MSSLLPSNQQDRCLSEFYSNTFAHLCSCFIDSVWRDQFNIEVVYSVVVICIHKWNFAPAVSQHGSVTNDKPIHKINIAIIIIITTVIAN